MSGPVGLKRTALHQAHLALGARMVDFAGWEMPVQYQGILAEHIAVRSSAGIFDISHMGRVYVHGPEASAFLEHVTTNDVEALEEHQAHYSLLCRPDGTTVDDILVYRLPEHYLVVVNAGNRERDLAFLKTHLLPGVSMRDDTSRTAMVAVQGPRAISIVQRITQEDLQSLGRYRCRLGDAAEDEAFFSRTGYTGEDGLEIIVSAQHAMRLWDALLAAGRDEGLRPCGLGARDTLRTEAGLPLYGHELTDSTNPFEAGLGSFVDLTKPRSLAGQALRALSTREPAHRLIGLLLESRVVARPGAPVFEGEHRIGTVTSGTYGPTLQKSIAMAYLKADHAQPERAVAIEVRGQRHPAVTVKLPFYRRRRRRQR